MNGIINVLKPPGMTSHDVIYFIRKTLKMKKVGHTGTLDPEAAGVLPVCVGKATKAVQYITEKRKRYIANIKFGLVTDTYDIYGAIMEQKKVDVLDVDKLKNILLMFKGNIKQKPPIYSAIKVKGKKLYEYARKNETVEIMEREVEIYDIKIIDIVQHDEIMIDIVCSKGTYIRSLCHDIGVEMGVGACMSQLIRTESKPFNIEDSYTLEEISKLAELSQIEGVFKTIEGLFDDYLRIDLKDSARISVLNGNNIYEQGMLNPDLLNTNIECTKIKIYNSDEFLGIGNIQYDFQGQRKFVKINNIFI